MGPGTADAAAPRPGGGGGPVYDAAVRRARELITASGPGMLEDPFAAADWIGAARAVIKELIRNA